MNDIDAALKFITCGSVDDGKSTLIGRLLVDSRSVLQDQLSSVSKSGTIDLAQFTDGLSAEREQGITIDVAYRYFNTTKRKFIIGDTPGHEQYTRNMVTAASSADAAVVLVDATKIKWQDLEVALLPQTRRHTLLCKMLRVNSIVFAVNKLDALGNDENAELAFNNIRAALLKFTYSVGIADSDIIPISALLGHNVVNEYAGWCGYVGPSLLDLLEILPVTPHDLALTFTMPVQYVEKSGSSSAVTDKGRRIFWGRVSTGFARTGHEVTVLPSGQTAKIVDTLTATRTHMEVAAGKTVGVVLDRELDVSRGDWLLDGTWDTHPHTLQRLMTATVVWMDVEPLVVGRSYLVLHGHKRVKARVTKIVHRIDIETLEETETDELLVNAIGRIEILLQEPIVAIPFGLSRVLGSFVMIDPATHRTSGAVLL